MSTKKKKTKTPSPTAPSHTKDSISDLVRQKEFERIFVQQSVSTSSHVGPLPPPAMLKEYETLIPNAAERLLALVEKEQAQRHINERYLLVAANQDAKAGRDAHLRGDIITVGVFVACSAMGLTLLFLDMNQIIAGTLLGSPLIGALAGYLFNRRGGQPDKKSLPDENSESQK